MDELPVEPIFLGMKNRLLEMLARFAPGITTWRVRLHRWRGVRLGTDVHIGADVLVETGFHWAWFCRDSRKRCYLVGTTAHSCARQPGQAYRPLRRATNL